MDYGKGSGAIAACARDAVGPCFEWMGILEQGSLFHGAKHGNEGAEMVVGGQ